MSIEHHNATSAGVPAGPGRTVATRRWPVWLLAGAILLGLVAAVARYLSLPAGQTAVMVMPGDRVEVAMLRLGSHPHGSQLLGSSLLTAWQLDSAAVAFVVLLGAWYLSAVLRLRPTRRWPWQRSVSFAAGLAVCLLATCGSIGVYDMALFSAHMIGHLAFVMVAPALLMAGRPVDLALTAAGPDGRLHRVLHSGPVSLLTAPPVALACYATVIVGSHLTGLMDLIMRNSWAGQLEHLVYLVIGCQFFLLVLGDPPVRWQLSTPARWFMLALSMAVDTFVGLVILQGNRPVYLTAMTGLSVNPLSDTHTGGAIMWFGGDAIMAAVMIALVVNWLGDPARQREDGRGWLEQARRATFAERVGGEPAGGSTGGATSEGPDGTDPDLDFDAAEERLARYNAWLASMHEPSARESSDPG